MNGRKTKRKDEGSRRRPKRKGKGKERQRMKPRKGRETTDSELAEAPRPTVRDEIDAAIKTLRHYLYLIIRSWF